MLLCLAIPAAAALLLPLVARADQRAPALFSAVESGDLSVVRQVLDRGADIEARNAEGLTPLMVAAKAGRAEVVRELLQRGAQVNARVGCYGITALTLAGTRDSDSEIAALLLQAGASREAPDERGRLRMIATELE
jgi:ankyrin repeat protein